MKKLELKVTLSLKLPARKLMYRAPVVFVKSLKLYSELSQRRAEFRIHVENKTSRAEFPATCFKTDFKFV